MKGQPTIVRDNQTFFASYQQLTKHDNVVGRLRLKPGEEHLLIDLLARGIRLIPSATAQLASRSKVFQARIFGNFMPDDTLAIYDAHTLLQVSSLYQRRGYRKVVLKLDRKNAGLGVHIFDSIEDLYNQVCGTNYPFPFVVQPFQEQCRDIRAIILGDYCEAYERKNAFNFRQNLHCGGDATPCPLSGRQMTFCREIMDRGGFPYAHLDLMITAEGDCRLVEINLRGGLRGASLSGSEYQRRVEAIHQELLSMETG